MKIITRWVGKLKIKAKLGTHFCWYNHLIKLSKQLECVYINLHCERKTTGEAKKALQRF